jgi:hypothetical protein
VVFGEKGHVVVGGSDHGIVYVFDRMTGDKLAELRAADQGMVQTVAVSHLRSAASFRVTLILQTHSREGIHTIVAATSNMRKPSIIKIWVHEAAPPATTKTREVKQTFDKVVNMVVLFAAIIFLFKYANLEFTVRNCGQSGELKLTYSMEIGNLFFRSMPPVPYQPLPTTANTRKTMIAATQEGIKHGKRGKSNRKDVAVKDAQIV